jgi:N-acetylglucosamine kinase-like BadF-type ATPase
VAALATDVCASAVAGDDVANELVDEAAAALVLHVEALLRHFSASTRVTVALAGGLLTPGSAIRTATVTAMCGRLPQTDMSGTQVDPARGALRMAARLLA